MLTFVLSTEKRLRLSSFILDIFSNFSVVHLDSDSDSVTILLSPG